MTTTTYNAAVVIARVEEEIPGRWTSVRAEDESWFGYDLDVIAARVRLSSADVEGELKLHVFSSLGVLRYTVDVSQAPVGVVVAAVNAAIDHAIGR